MQDSRQVMLERLLSFPEASPPKPGNEGAVEGNYLLENTVEPLESIVIGNRKCWLRMMPFMVEQQPYLKISLKVFDTSEGVVAMSIDDNVPRPKRYWTGWVDRTARDFSDAGEWLAMGGELPGYDTLRRLIATRIAYYLSGGSANNKAVRRN